MRPEDTTRRPSGDDGHVGLDLIDAGGLFDPHFDPRPHLRILVIWKKVRFCLRLFPECGRCASRSGQRLLPMDSLFAPAAPCAGLWCWMCLPSVGV